MPIIISNTPTSGLVRTEEEYLDRRQTVINASIAAAIIAGVGVAGLAAVPIVAGAGGLSALTGTGGVTGLLTKAGSVLDEFGGDDSIDSFGVDVVSASQLDADDGETNGLLDYNEVGDSDSYLDLWDNTEGY